MDCANVATCAASRVDFRDLADGETLEPPRPVDAINPAYKRTPSRAGPKAKLVIVLMGCDLDDGLVCQQQVQHDKLKKRDIRIFELWRARTRLAESHLCGDVASHHLAP